MKISPKSNPHSSFVLTGNFCLSQIQIVGIITEIPTQAIYARRWLNILMASRHRLDAVQTNHEIGGQ